MMVGVGGKNSGGGAQARLACACVGQAHDYRAFGILSLWEGADCNVTEKKAGRG